MTDVPRVVTQTWAHFSKKKPDPCSFVSRDTTDVLWN